MDWAFETNEIIGPPKLAFFKIRLKYVDPFEIGRLGPWN